MATLTVQTIARTGLETTYAAAAAGGDQFANDGKEFLHVKNGSGGDITVTIESQVSSPPAGTAVTNQAVVVTAGEERMIGPFPKSAYNDASGYVQITYSGVTTLTIAAIKLPDA